MNIAFHKVRDVYVLNLRTKTQRRLTYEPMNGMHPTWSPDGKQIAFMSWRNGRTEIFTAKSDGTEQQLLVSMPSGDAIDPSWSPDARYIAFVHVTGKPPDEQRVVYTVDVHTKRITRISR
jgi:TolB protein